LLISLKIKKTTTWKFSKNFVKFILNIQSWKFIVHHSLYAYAAASVKQWWKFNKNSACQRVRPAFPHHPLPSGFATVH